MTHLNGLPGPNDDVVSRTHSQRRAQLTSLLWCLDLWAARLVGHCSANQSREVRAHRDTTDKSGVPCFGCLHSAHHARRGLPSRARAPSGPDLAPHKVLGPLQAHHLRNKQLTYCLGRPRRSGDDLRAGTRPENHGGRVTERRRRPARCLETPRGSAFESPRHRAWSGRRRRSGDGGAPRGSVFCFSLYDLQRLSYV